MRHLRRFLLPALLLAFCVSAPALSAAPQRLAVSADGRNLVTADGRPFFYLADTAWALFQQLKREDVTLYLQDRADKGFTVIQAVAAVWRSLEHPNVSGDRVFVDGDTRRPNERFFAHVDFAIDEAEKRGLYVALVPIWGGYYLPPREGGPLPLSADGALEYGRFLGRRYGEKPVIFVIGGDYDPLPETLPVWRALAQGIRETAPHSLQTYHPTGRSTSATFLHHEGWLDFNMTQSGHKRLNDSHAFIAADYARTPAKPVIDAEPAYERINDGLQEVGTPGVTRVSDADVRRTLYHAVFAGAAGVTYGCAEIYSFYSPADPVETDANWTGVNKRGGRWGQSLRWQETLDEPGARQMQHLRRLIESRPPLLRRPDQAVLVRPQEGIADRVSVLRAEDGSYAMIYSASGQPFELDLRRLTGTELKAWWFDPRTGAATAADPVIRPFQRRPAPVLRTFTPPSSGTGHDWVLVLDDAGRGYPPPGSVR